MTHPAQTSSSRNPRVSVIMPAYNAVDFLREAVESVRAQTLPAWELLLVDDGSSDGSFELARDLAATDDRIHLLQHPDRANLGASATRNLGLSRARGDYFAMLDADDVWLPHKLSEQVEIMDRYPFIGALTGSTEIWYSWAGDAADDNDYRATIGVADQTIVEPPQLLVLSLRARVRMPCTCSLIVRRSVMERIGGFEERFRRVFTDQAMYVKLFLETPLLVVDRCWDRYRQHPASACNVADRSGYSEEAELEYLDWFEQTLQERGMKDSEVHRALRSYRYWRHEHPRLYRVMMRGRKVADRLRRSWSRARGSA